MHILKRWEKVLINQNCSIQDSYGHCLPSRYGTGNTLKMKKLKFDRENGKLVFLVILILIIITLFTRYYGSADAGDYSDSAKFFSGKYAGDIRNSHSYLYGFIHSFFVGAFENFFFFKITSLVCLALIIYSVYYISNKDRKTLWLILLSPTAWYRLPG